MMDVEDGDMDVCALPSSGRGLSKDETRSHPPELVPLSLEILALLPLDYLAKQGALGGGTRPGEEEPGEGPVGEAPPGERQLSNKDRPNASTHWHSQRAETQRTSGPSDSFLDVSPVFVSSEALGHPSDNPVSFRGQTHEACSTNKQRPLSAESARHMIQHSNSVNDQFFTRKIRRPSSVGSFQRTHKKPASRDKGEASLWNGLHRFSRRPEGQEVDNESRNFAPSLRKLLQQPEKHQAAAGSAAKTPTRTTTCCHQRQQNETVAETGNPTRYATQQPWTPGFDMANSGSSKSTDNSHDPLNLSVKKDKPLTFSDTNSSDDDVVIVDEHTTSNAKRSKQGSSEPTSKHRATSSDAPTTNNAPYRWNIPQGTPHFDPRDVREPDTPWVTDQRADAVPVQRPPPTQPPQPDTPAERQLPKYAHFPHRPRQRKPPFPGRHTKLSSRGYYFVGHRETDDESSQRSTFVSHGQSSLPSGASFTAPRPRPELTSGPRAAHVRREASGHCSPSGRHPTWRSNMSLRRQCERLMELTGLPILPILPLELLVPFSPSRISVGSLILKTINSEIRKHRGTFSRELEPNPQHGRIATVAGSWQTSNHRRNVHGFRNRKRLAPEPEYFEVTSVCHRDNKQHKRRPYSDRPDFDLSKRQRVDLHSAESHSFKEPGDFQRGSDLTRDPRRPPQHRQNGSRFSGERVEPVRHERIAHPGHEWPFSLDGNCVISLDESEYSTAINRPTAAVNRLPTQRNGNLASESSTGTRVIQLDDHSDEDVMASSSGTQKPCSPFRRRPSLNLDNSMMKTEDTMDGLQMTETSYRPKSTNAHMFPIPRRGLASEEGRKGEMLFHGLGSDFEDPASPFENDAAYNQPDSLPTMAYLQSRIIAEVLSQTGSEKTSLP